MMGLGRRISGLKKYGINCWVSKPAKKIRDLPQELGTAYLGGGKNMSQKWEVSPIFGVKIRNI